MDAMPKMLDKPSLETKLFPDMSNAQTKPHTQKPSMHVMPKKFAKPSWDKMFAETGRVGGLLPLFRRGLSLSVSVSPPTSLACSLSLSLSFSLWGGERECVCVCVGVFEICDCGTE